MNGAVGYQLVEDGTPLSLGLILISAALLFIGTGYIALDTGFSWTGYWDDTLVAPNRAYALYTLYQLVPLLFIVIFFLLEAYLVLRVLGERRPMRMFLCSPPVSICLLTCSSMAPRRSTPVRHCPGLPIRDQRAHLQRHKRQDQRWPVRDALLPRRRRHDLGVLEQHHRGRLAHAR